MMTQVGPHRWADLSIPSNSHLKEWTPAPGASTTAAAKAAAHRHKFLLPVSVCLSHPRDMLGSEIEEEAKYLRAWIKMADEAPGKFTEIQRLHRRYAIARLDVLQGEIGR